MISVIELQELVESNAKDSKNQYIKLYQPRFLGAMAWQFRSIRLGLLIQQAHYS